MSDLSDSDDDGAKEFEKLHELGKRLDESQDVAAYQGIINAAKTSINAKQLAAELIPKFSNVCPHLSVSAINTHIDLIAEEEPELRVLAIQGLPLFCNITPEQIAKIVDILVPLVAAEEFVERDAVHKALMALLNQDVKVSLTALFKYIGSVDEQVTIREKVLSFIREKVFPIKSELLKPQEEMERHITELIKQSLEDVTGAEFGMFMDFLKSLSIFGEEAPPERMKELIGIIEGRAGLDAQFNVSNADHIDRLISCLFIALPFGVRGASFSKFLKYLKEHILLISDELPDEQRLDLLKALAEISPYTTREDSRLILPSVVGLLKKNMPRGKTGEECNFACVECLLYTFHHLSHKAPNSANKLCGYKRNEGEAADRLGEDFLEKYKEFTERLSYVEELTRAKMKELIKEMVEKKKAMAAAESDEAEDSINTTTELRTYNNILAMTKTLQAKKPFFIGDKRIKLCWKEGTEPDVAPAASAGSSGEMVDPLLIQTIISYLQGENIISSNINTLFNGGRHDVAKRELRQFFANSKFCLGLINEYLNREDHQSPRIKEKVSVQAKILKYLSYKHGFTRLTFECNKLLTTNAPSMALLDRLGRVKHELEELMNYFRPLVGQIEDFECMAALQVKLEEVYVEETKKVTSSRLIPRLFLC